MATNDTERNNTMNIKTTIAAAIIAIMPMAAQAQDKVSCELVGDLAQVIMENRQAGAILSRQMKIADGNAFVEALVREAYSRPRYSTQRHQDRVVTEFRNDAELICYGREA